MIQISKIKRDQVIVVSIIGNIDALTAEEVTRYLKTEIDSGHNKIVANLALVDFMSSAGLRTILMTLKECRRLGGDLCLAAAQADIEKVLNMCGFTNILKTYTTVEQAIAEFT